MGKANKSKGNPVKVRKGQCRAVIISPIAYVIEDKIFGKLEVRNSANAWWLDRGKVEDLIKACKLDATMNESCSYAGITEDQYKYFAKMHPYFYTVKKLCNEVPCVRARSTVFASLHNPETAKWYLERKRRAEFGMANVGTAVQVNIGADVVPDAKVKKVVDEFEKKLKNTIKEEDKSD